MSSQLTHWVTTIHEMKSLRQSEQRRTERGDWFTSMKHGGTIGSAVGMAEGPDLYFSIACDSFLVELGIRMDNKR